MLGGLDPVIIFQFSKLAGTAAGSIARIPIISSIPTVIDQPPIPVYLSEKLFNIVISGTAKNVDIETDTESLTSGATPDVNQKGIQAGVEVSIEGKQDSVALTLLSALIDLVYEKVTSKEYAITFMYGATTVFRGLLHSYSAETIEGTDKLAIKISLSRGAKNPTKQNPVDEVPASGPSPLPGDVAS
jgi:hypothetical protein